MNSKQLIILITPFTCIFNLWALEKPSDTIEQIRQKLQNKENITHQGATYTLASIKKHEDPHHTQYVFEKPAIFLGILIVGKDVISINESEKQDLSTISIEDPKRVYNMALMDCSFGALIATILIFANLTQ